jgi:glycosyltransferase involved in cell wall biosynthesis
LKEALKISIIIPSYNQAEYLEETLQSVICQNYPNTELLVIDGGSNDNTVSVIHKYESCLKYWVSEDKGLFEALDKGFKHATRDIMGWINSAAQLMY